MRDRKLERLYRRSSRQAAKRAGFATRGQYRPHRRAVLAVLPAVAAAVIASLVAGSPIARNGKGGVAAADVTPIAFTSACSTNSGAGNQVEVAGVWAGEEQDRFRSVLDRFSQETGIKVTFANGSRVSEQPDRELANTLEARVEQGCAPDVALLPQPGLLADLARAGHIKPLPSETAKLVGRNYSPAWQQLASFDRELYGVWFKASNKSVIWYRNDAFERVGVQPPRTWAELQKVAGALSASGITPFSIGGADGWTLTDWFENIYLRTAGADMYDKLARHEIPWTDPSVKHALTTLAQVFARPEWLAGGTEGALHADFEASVKNVFSEAPTAAMVYEGDFVANELARSTSPGVGQEAKVFPFPSVEEPHRAAVALGGDVAVLFDPENDAARSLIRFLATPEAAEPWARLGGFTSPNKKLNPGLYPDEATREAATALANSETIRFDLSDLQPAAFGSTPGEGMWKIFQDFLRHPAKVEETAHSLEVARRAAN